ncbi:MAG: hypothetical protein IKX20_00620 [Paludibacteraceae bacterium]|nr:hypothetical protein [Paludibacteraceae bacterium]
MEHKSYFHIIFAKNLRKITFSGTHNGLLNYLCKKFPKKGIKGKDKKEKEPKRN